MRFSLFTLLSLSAVATARPFDVFVPEILTPAAGAVWTKGSSQTVTWDVSNPPSQITNPIGKIVLASTGGALLETLASGFNILAGSEAVTVPADVAEGNYTIVLFGDSGNQSPVFEIVNLKPVQL